MCLYMLDFYADIDVELIYFIHVSELFLISNLLSLSRFFLLIPCVIFILSDNYLAALVMIFLIWISDLLDGYIARKRNEISELGKIIDPIADKLSVAVIMLVLLFEKVVPLWFVILVIFRDLLIISGGIYLKYKKSIVLQSDIKGKLAVFVIGLTFFMYIFNIPVRRGEFGDFFLKSFITSELLLYILLFLSIVMIIVSLSSYFYRFLEINKKN